MADQNQNNTGQGQVVSPSSGAFSDSPVQSQAQDYSQNNFQSQSFSPFASSINNSDPSSASVNPVQDLQTPDTSTLDQTPVSNYSRPESNGVARAQTSAVPKKPFALRKVLLILAIATGIILFLVFLVVFISSNQTTQQTISDTTPTQDAQIEGGLSSDIGFDVEGQDKKLIVNGAVIANGNIALVGGNETAFGQISASGVAANQTYTLPNASGAICLDSNNCDFLTQADLATTTIAGQTGNIAIGDGLQIAGSTLSSSIVQSTVNNFTGAVSVQGTGSQVSVTNNNGTIKLGTPQNIATSSSPTFNDLTLSGEFTVQGAGTNSIDGNLIIANKLAIGDSAAIDSCGSLIDDCDTTISLIKESNSVDSSIPLGAYFGLRLNPASTPATAGFVGAAAGGFNTSIKTGNATDFNDGLLIGGYGVFTHNGTGTAPNGIGFGGGINNNSTGTIERARALSAGVTNNSTGTIEVAIGLEVFATDNNSGTVTDNYGIKIKYQGEGTNDYGLAIEGAETQAFWLGSIGDYTDSANGIAFGASRDTNLYRSDAGTLTTGGGLTVGSSTGGYKLTVTDTGTDNVARFNGTGVNQCTVVAGTGWSCSSDERLKTNINSVQGTDALSTVLGLNAVTYNWLNNPDGDLQSGFIAQEVQKILPHLVTDDGNGYLSLSKEGLIPYLAGAIQEQQQQIDEIKASLGSGGQTPEIASLGAGINTLGELSIDNLEVTTGATIAKLEVSGESTFKGDITFAGKIIGNELTRGKLTVPAGSKQATHDFSEIFSSSPNVILTPVNDFAPQFRVVADTSRFTLYLKENAQADITFNYQVQQ